MCRRSILGRVWWGVGRERVCRRPGVQANHDDEKVEAVPAGRKVATNAEGHQLEDQLRSEHPVEHVVRRDDQRLLAVHTLHVGQGVCVRARACVCERAHACEQLERGGGGGSPHTPYRFACGVCVCVCVCERACVRACSRGTTRTKAKRERVSERERERGGGGGGGGITSPTWVDKIAVDSDSSGV